MEEANHEDPVLCDLYEVSQTGKSTETTWISGCARLSGVMDGAISKEHMVSVRGEGNVLELTAVVIARTRECSSSVYY